MIIDVFLKLESEDIEYVSWKNNHLIEQSLAGKRDVDLYVPLSHRDGFEKVLKDNNWLKVDNKFIRYPWVTHFYILSPTGVNYHLHVYYKIVTGESGLKEYELPWGKYLINNRVKSKHGIWMLNKEAQSFIYFVRHLLKNASYQSRILYNKEIESYDEEFQLIGRYLDYDYGDIPFNIKNYIKGSGLLGPKVKLANIRCARSFKSQFYFYRRSFNPLLISRFVDLYYRFLNKIFYKAKKVMLDGGVVIAVTGIDGSGKTTMLEYIKKDTKSFLTIRNIHMGKPLPYIFMKTIELVNKIKNNKVKKEKSIEKSNTIKESNLITSMVSLSIAFFRLLRARQCMSYARQGYVVATDRWPTKERGKMDGPSINTVENGSNLIQRLAVFEDKLYQLMPSADVCFVFTVPLDVALKRNAERDEVENEYELRKRYSNNNNPLPISDKVIIFNNEGELAEQLEIFRMLYWKEISNVG